MSTHNICCHGEIKKMSVLLVDKAAYLERTHSSYLRYVIKHISLDVAFFNPEVLIFFLISPLKHILWALIRSTLLRCFL